MRINFGINDDDDYYNQATTTVNDYKLLSWSVYVI